jgi:RimJ/RimL family protein N-acetyltransferase
MFTELESKDFPTAVPFFKEVDYSISLPAVFEGNNPGRIFIDEPDHPEVAFALTVEGYFLAGNPDKDRKVVSTAHFLREKIFTGKIFLDDGTNLSLAVTPASWGDRLPDMIPTHEKMKLLRYHYCCQKLTFDWRNHLNHEFQVRSFDQDLLENSDIVIPEEILDWASIVIRWGSRENFYENAVSYCVLHKDKVVTICSSDCFARDRIDVGIYTLPIFRHQGLASVATAATVEAAFNRGFQEVGWHCNADNIGSVKTAEKVGFKRQNKYFYYFYVFDEIDHMASMGWFYFKQGQYRKTTDYYEHVFKAREENPDYFYHLAALAWAALEIPEMAIKYLNAAVDRGWKNREWTEKEEKFRFLHNNPEWKAVLARMNN